jgi:hypothetical protein
MRRRGGRGGTLRGVARGSHGFDCGGSADRSGRDEGWRLYRVDEPPSEVWQVDGRESRMDWLVEIVCSEHEVLSGGND